MFFSHPHPADTAGNSKLLCSACRGKAELAVCYCSGCDKAFCDQHEKVSSKFRLYHVLHSCKKRLIAIYFPGVSLEFKFKFSPIKIKPFLENGHKYHKTSGEASCDTNTSDQTCVYVGLTF